MKKLILFLTIITLSYSCSSDSNSSNNNNNNSFTNSMDYEFTITINGEVHKIKGNTTNGIPYGQISSYYQIMNKCYIENDHDLSLTINDVTAPNYISGQNLDCTISFSNLLLGNNQATVEFSGGYFTQLASSLGAYNSYFSFQSVSGAANFQIENKLTNFTITDLGTTSLTHTVFSIYDQYNFGQTLKGNYSGTIYLRNTTNFQFTIPVQISIDFKALRQY